MAGVKFEKYAFGHEMSNDQSEKQTLETQHKAGDPLGESRRYTTLQIHFSALHYLYLRPFQTLVAGSCAGVEFEKYAIGEMSNHWSEKQSLQTITQQISTTKAAM